MLNLTDSQSDTGESTFITDSNLDIEAKIITFDIANLQNNRHYNLSINASNIADWNISETYISK